MHAEVMAIGDELTSGQRLDTNSQWLSQQLGQMGVAVHYHTTVSDDLPAMVGAFRAALDRSPLVVVTGGLGPTADDLTRQALAEATGRPLELRPEALQWIESIFARFGREMPAQNRIQAQFPAGSRVIDNPHGTAPGIDLDASGPHGPSRLFALPGVPAEMFEMWSQTVQPALATLLGVRQVIRHHRIKCFGTGESHLEAMLPDLIRRDRDPRVGITVHRATITLRVSASANTEDECFQKMRPTLDTIRACLGDLVFGEEDDELEHAVIRLLEQHDARLAICEWGTAGLVVRWLSAADTSQRLRAGLVVSSADALHSLLAESPPASEPAELVHWLAEYLRQRCQTEFALAVGPLPAPDDEHPRILMGLASPQETQVFDRGYYGHPDVVLERAAKQALDLLRHELLRRNSNRETPTEK